MIVFLEKNNQQVPLAFAAALGVGCVSQVRAAARPHAARAKMIALTDLEPVPGERSAYLTQTPYKYVHTFFPGKERHKENTYLYEGGVRLVFFALALFFK